MATRHIISITEALDIADKRITAAQRVIPSVLDALEERRARAANRESPRSETIVQTSGVSDPTAQLAAELASISVHRQHIANAGRLLLRVLDHLDECCRDALGRRYDDPEAPTCVGYPEGRECWDMPGFEVDRRTGVVYTRKSRLCDRCELERQRDERAERRAQNERRRRLDPKKVAATITAGS